MIHFRELITSQDGIEVFKGDDDVEFGYFVVVRGDFGIGKLLKCENNEGVGGKGIMYFGFPKRVLNGGFGAKLLGAAEGEEVTAVTTGLCGLGRHSDSPVFSVGDQIGSPRPPVWLFLLSGCLYSVPCFADIVPKAGNGGSREPLFLVLKRC